MRLEKRRYATTSATRLSRNGEPQELKIAGGFASHLNTSPRSPRHRPMPPNSVVDEKSSSKEGCSNPFNFLTTHRLIDSLINDTSISPELEDHFESATPPIAISHSLHSCDRNLLGPRREKFCRSTIAGFSR